MKPINAGKLGEKVQLLELTQDESGWQWTGKGSRYARVTPGSGKTLFSAVGIGANTLEIVMRSGPISLHNAFLWKGQHCFLSEIRPDPDSPGHLLIRAALVPVSSCTFSPEDGGKQFPAVLTEKYLKHEQDMPMARNVLTYVLVTPKAIELTSGRLVKVDGKDCHILTAHTLDPHKNEYEIQRECDL